jgi:hypothetical protein
VKRRVRCQRCGRVFRVKLEVHPGLIFHDCPDRRRPGVIGARRRVRLPDVEVTLEESTRAIWDGFRDALPGDALLRRVDQ